MKMATPAPDTATKKKRAALRVFGESIAVEAVGEVDSSLTYSTGSEKSTSVNGMNDENHPNGNDLASCMTPCEKCSGHKEPKAVSFANMSGDHDNDCRKSRQHAKDLFNCKRSPMRPDLVKKTQEAIRKATISVNETMLIGQKQVKKKFSQDEKSEWQAQVDEARNFNNQMHESRLRMLALKKQLSSESSREKARRQQAHKAKLLTEIDKESKFKSAVHRDHQKVLREQQEHRRRASVSARSRLRENAKRGEEVMRMRRIDEDMVILAERHESSVAQREKQASDAAAKRKSFVFRNGDARRIRELYTLMEAERSRKARDDFSLTEQGHRDMQEYRRKLELDRRQSLAFRNAMAAHQRKKEKEHQARLMEEEHQSYLLKFAADRDVDLYKKHIQDRNRQSLAKRNDDARRIRMEESNRKAIEVQAEHESYELTRQAYKDIAQYRSNEEARRRRSLKDRGAEHVRQRKKEDEAKAQEAAITHHSFELKRAASKDAEEYRQQMDATRRASLAFRNDEARRIRLNEAKRRNNEFINEHESYELKWAGERDVAAYQKAQKKALRESLATRNQLSREQRQILAGLDYSRQEQEYASFALEQRAAKDVEEYKRKQEESRRTSLQNRNAERAKHANVMRELSIISQQKESESYALKWAAENDVKEYMTKLEMQRRDSFKLRGKQFLQARKVEEDQRVQELVERQHDEDMRAEDSRALKEYRDECEMRDRSSLQFRGKELNRQRLEASVKESNQQKVDRQNFELEQLAKKDVEDYLKECQKRRRMSLALRAKETRRHAALKRDQREREVRQRRQLVHGRLMDQRYAELAEQEERAKRALAAIQHANRTSNPFSGLL